MQAAHHFQRVENTVLFLGNYAARSAKRRAFSGIVGVKRGQSQAEPFLQVWQENSAQLIASITMDREELTEGIDYSFVKVHLVRMMRKQL